MCRIGVIGVGAHSWLHHLPSLGDCSRRNPGWLELSAVCDLDTDRAKEAKDLFGFKSSYGSIGEMLGKQKLDGIIVVTPFGQTCAVAMELLKERIPLLIEKPPACSMKEARGLERHRAELGVPVMVSMNRRHDPSVRRLKQVVENCHQGHLEVRFLRSKRTESWFLFETGIHFLDTINYLCGPLTKWAVTPIGETDRRQCIFECEFQRGTTCRVVIDPMAGELEESYTFQDGETTATARTGDKSFPDAAVFRHWKDGRMVEENAEYADKPIQDRMGTVLETETFLRVISGESDPEPDLSEVLPALDLAIRLKDWSRTVAKS